MNTNATRWVRETIGNDSVRAAAIKSGIKQPTLNLQLNSNKVTAETVVAIARAYGANILEGLEIQGLLTRDELSEYRTAPEWRKVSDRELLDEIERRLTGGAASNELASGDEVRPPLTIVPQEQSALAAHSAPNRGKALREAIDAEQEMGDPGPDGFEGA